MPEKKDNIEQRLAALEQVIQGSPGVMGLAQRMDRQEDRQADQKEFVSTGLAARDRETEKRVPFEQCRVNRERMEKKAGKTWASAGSVVTLIISLAVLIVAVFEILK